MMLLLFLDDIRSERELMRIIPGAARLRSVLSKARKRRGKDVFLALFSRFVHQCVEARLVEGSKIYVDARLVDANASLSSVRALQAEVVAAIECVALEQGQKLNGPLLSITRTIV